MKHFHLTCGGTILPALIACALWGSLYPCIKIGYMAFAIDTHDIPSICLFAGLRFLICGAVLSVSLAAREKKIAFPVADCWKYIAATGVLSVTLHYALTYVALSTTDGGKSAILKQVGFLFLPCFAFLFRREDKFSPYKVVGALLGFAAVVVINLDGLQFTFNWGDVLILCASFCMSASTVVAKKAYDCYAPAYILACGQLFGGTLLIMVGLCFGGRFARFDWLSVAVLGYICLASIAAYLLWENMLKSNPMSRMAVIKSTEPLFAVVFSGILLGETIFHVTYLLAAGMVGVAIYLSRMPGRIDGVNTRISCRSTQTNARG